MRKNAFLSLTHRLTVSKLLKILFNELKFKCRHQLYDIFQLGSRSPNKQTHRYLICIIRKFSAAFTLVVKQRSYCESKQEMKLNLSRPNSSTNVGHTAYSSFSQTMSFETASKAPAVTWDELRKEVKFEFKICQKDDVNNFNTCFDLIDH